jgi:hypothetical protein
MNLPIVGQALTAGGLLAGIVLLGWRIPDPDQPHVVGVIHAPADKSRVVLETSKTIVYSRPLNLNVTSFLLFQDEAAEASYFTITISHQDGASAGTGQPYGGEYTLHCVPIRFLRQMFDSKEKETEFFIVPFQRTLDTSEKVTDYEIRTPDGKLSFQAENRREDCVETTGRSTAKLPASGVTSVAVPAPPLPTAPADIGQAVNQLRSGDLAERLVARDTLTQALTSQNAFSAAANGWRILTSTYDDDIGLLTAWLGQLRRTGEAGKEATTSVLVALSTDQGSYLVALFTHPDRSLRLAAKETVGWLLQNGTSNRPAPIEKILDPLRLLISGTLNTSIVRQKTNNSIPPLRTYVVYDAVDILQRPWCTLPPGQRQRTQAIFDVMSLNDVGPRAAEKLAAMKAACG